MIPRKKVKSYFGIGSFGHFCQAELPRGSRGLLPLPFDPSAVAIDGEELYRVRVTDGFSPALSVTLVGVTVTSDSFPGAGEGLPTGSVADSGVQTIQQPDRQKTYDIMQ